MKLLSAVFLASLLSVGFARASITPVLTSETPSAGNTLWDYSISVDSLEELNASLPDGGTFFTIDNFVGYVSGSITAPTGWTASYTGGDLDFTYIGPPTISTQTDFTGFSALSTDSAVNAAGTFAYQAENIQTGGADFGGGPIDVPAVPEPTSVGLLGGGLIGVAVFFRRKFARS